LPILLNLLLWAVLQIIPIDLAFQIHIIPRARHANCITFLIGMPVSLLNARIIIRAKAPFNNNSHEPARGRRIKLASAILPSSPADSNMAWALFVKIESAIFRLKNKSSQNMVLD
jgi:hypothetical protein